MSGPLWLLALALPVLLGSPLLSHASFRHLPPSSRIVLSGAAGTVLLSAAMTGAVLAGLRWNVPVLALAAWTLAACLGLLLEREPASPRHSVSEPLGAEGAAAYAVAALAVAVALLATWSGSATSPDLVFFWGAKAQQFAAAETIDVPFLQNVFHKYMHLYYPPFVTNVFAFATMAAGRLPWTGAILTFPMLLAALAIGLPGILRPSLSRRAAAHSALAVAVIAFAGIEADIAGNGEMPLILMEGLAAALLVSPAAARGSTQLLGGLLLAGVATAKVEGLPFAIAAGALFLASAPRPRGPKAVRLFGPMAVCLGGWFLFGATRGLFVGYAGEGRMFDLYPARLPLVIRLIGKALGEAGYGLPWLVPLAVLLLSGRPRRAALIPLGTAAALVAFFLFTYLHRAEDPTLWISWSAARIFMPVAVLLVIGAACASASGSPTPDTAAPSPR